MLKILFVFAIFTLTAISTQLSFASDKEVDTNVLYKRDLLVGLKNAFNDPRESVNAAALDFAIDNNLLNSSDNIVIVATELTSLLINSVNPRTRFNAAVILGKLEQNVTANVIVNLIESLSDEGTFEHSGSLDYETVSNASTTSLIDLEKYDSTVRNLLFQSILSQKVGDVSDAFMVLSKWNDIPDEVAAKVAQIYPELDSRLQESALEILSKKNGITKIYSELFGKAVSDYGHYIVEHAAKAFVADNELPAEVEDKLILTATSDSFEKSSAIFALGILEPILQESPFRILVEALKDNRYEVRNTSLDALRKIGKNKKALTPIIIEMLNDDEKRVCENAIKTLGSFGHFAEEAIPSLVELGVANGSKYSTNVSQALADIGVKAIPALINLFGSTNSSISREALYVLRDAKLDVVPALINGLESTQPNIQLFSTILIGDKGPIAIAAKSKLIDLLDDVDARIRKYAVYALGQIDNDSEQTLDLLVNKLQDESLEVQLEAIEAISHFKDKAAIAVLPVYEFLSHGNSDIRTAALNTLDDIGQPAIPYLLKATSLGLSDLNFIGSIYSVLGKKQKYADLIYGELFSRLQRKFITKLHQAWIIETLSTLEISSDDFISYSIESLSDSRKEVKIAAVNALGKLWHKSVLILPALSEAIKDKSISHNIISVLHESNLSDIEQIPNLLWVLRNGSNSEKKALAKLIGKIGKSSKPIVLALLNILKVDDLQLRSEVFDSLLQVHFFNQEKLSVQVVLSFYESALTYRDTNYEYYTAAIYSMNNISSDLILLTALDESTNNFGRQRILSEQDKTKTVLADLSDILSNQNILNFPLISQELISQLLLIANELEQITNSQVLVLQSVKSALPDLPAYEPSQAAIDSLVSKNKFYLYLEASFYTILAHFLFWVSLIFLYPRFLIVQSIFFWNPWVRRILGFGYVDLLLTWIPYLRNKLLSPFKANLLLDSSMYNFDDKAYFDGTLVETSSDTLCSISQAFYGFSGQVILEGESGLGKTMALMHYCATSRRNVAFISAERCGNGVIAALQHKLHGHASDEKFLKKLVFAGSFDICIDGINEVSSDVRAQITHFMERYYKGNIIVTSQPMEWNKPVSAKTWKIQPLRSSQIIEFLCDYFSSEVSDDNTRLSTFKAKCLSIIENLSPEQVDQAHIVLSNPMDLCVFAELIIENKQPQIFNLRKQQLEVINDDFLALYGHSFPLTEFAEFTFEKRKLDKVFFSRNELAEYLNCEITEVLSRHKLLIRYHDKLQEQTSDNIFYRFRHEKIMDFFSIYAFLGEHSNRQTEYLSDPRFRGIYFLLADTLPLNDAILLRDELNVYAAENKDHSLSDEFLLKLRSRSKTSTF